MTRNSSPTLSLRAWILAGVKVDLGTVSLSAILPKSLLLKVSSTFLSVSLNIKQGAAFTKWRAMGAHRRRHAPKQCCAPREREAPCKLCKRGAGSRTLRAYPRAGGTA